MRNTAIYVRVSDPRREQRPEVQIEALVERCRSLGYGEPTIYSDGMSGTAPNRPELAALMDAVRQQRHERIMVWMLDRLSRSVTHLLHVLGELQHRNVVVESLIDGISTDPKSSNPMTQAFIQIRAVFAEMESRLTSERVKEGMTYAKRNGTRSGLPVGRPPKKIDNTAINNAILDGEQPLSVIAQDHQVSRGWIYKLNKPILHLHQNARTMTNL